MRAWRIGAAVVAVAIVAVILALPRGGHGYHARLEVADAAGLRDGSPVTIGGVKAGKVSLRLGRGDKVIADLAIDRRYAPIGRDARAAIAAVNLLGQKRLELDVGTKADPAPSGFVIPAARVTTSTDLDQVLSVLDADTRTRLAVLINEAGASFHGRRADLSRVLQQLPASLVRGTALLDNLVADNDTLANTLERMDGFVAAMSSHRRSLTRMIGVAGQAAATAATRHADLRATLRQAPATLATLQRFLGDLRTTTVPLGPAARNVAATAPALAQTLQELEPFRRAATPALGELKDIAPQLTRLANGATPVLRRAQPTARALAEFGTALAPVSETLDHSVDNILAVVENWSRAIQFRDGLSHVFRGEASVTPETLRSIIGRLTRGKRHRRPVHRRPGGRLPEVRVPAPVKTPDLPKVKVPAVPPLPKVKVPEVGVQVQPPAVPVPEVTPPAAKSLLDYLLG